MLSFLATASFCFAPTSVLRPQRGPLPESSRAVCMTDGIVEAAGMIGRASTFGLAIYAAAQMVDPPHRRTGPAADQSQDDDLKRFGWLNADMSVPLPTLEDLEDRCVRIGQLRGYAASRPLFC